MFAALRLRLFGRYCKAHDLWYASELCPAKVRELDNDQQTRDRRATEPLVPPSLRRPPVKR